MTERRRRRRKYRVTWARVSDPESVFVCTGLSMALAFRRVQRAIRVGGPVIVHNVEVTHDWMEVTAG